MTDPGIIKTDSAPLQHSFAKRWIQWLWGDSWVWRGTLVLMALPLLVYLFYQEENWRGKRAWAECQREAAAQGLVTNWADLVPPPVPEQSNIFGVPEMQDWFTGRGSRSISGKLSFQNFSAFVDPANSVVARVIIVPPGTPLKPNDADLLLQYQEPFLTYLTPEQAASTNLPAAEQVIPLIKMDEVPLEDAIKNLARQAGINYMTDHWVNYTKPDANGLAHLQPTVSSQWTNVTASTALQSLLAEYGLVLIPNPRTGIGYIAKKTPNNSVVVDSADLPRAKTNTPGELIIPLIVMDEVPLTDAIKNLARQADLRYVLDPKIPYTTPDENGVIHLPNVSLRWENLTAVEALKAVLANYNLAMTTNAKSGIVHIRTRNPAKDVPEGITISSQLQQLVVDAVTAATNHDRGAHLTSPIGFDVAAKPSESFKTARVIVRSDKIPYTIEVAQFFPKNPVETGQIIKSEIQARSTGSNTFEIFLNPPPGICAADYIAWSDQLEEDFNTIREALKRPYARMEGDYSEPAQLPIPNFVCMRTITQTLCTRAQCYLLLNQPEKAARELVMVRDLCRSTEARPTGRPMTLVAAMVNSAVTGMYAQTLGEGLRMKQWREPELQAFEAQLKEVNLPALLAAGMDCERISSCHVIEELSPENVNRVFSGSSTPSDPLEQWKDFNFRFLTLSPRGWVYQNMATIARFHLESPCGWNATKGIFNPRQADDAFDRIQRQFNHPSPYNSLAAGIVPNYSRAALVTAHNQTMVNEARIACALERYRLASGNYPKTLDMLAPQFIDKLPVDIIGGGPMQYQCDDGAYTLYSIGWNARDDHGVSQEKDDRLGDIRNGDWVWQFSRKL